MATACDLVLVIGARNSSNSNRLQEIGAACGARSYLVADARSVKPEWFDGVSTVGITAGASAPEELVQGLIKHLQEIFDANVEELDGVTENVSFRLPRELDRRVPVPDSEPGNVPELTGGTAGP